MHNFDWDDVRIFLEVVRAGSLNRAAERLNVNQSTVSRRITALEKRLGVSLFERARGASWIMTAAGEETLRSAEQMMDNANAIARDVLRNSTELRGPVAVTCADAGAQILAIPCFAECARRFPQLELSLLISNDALDLASREADIALRVAESAPPDVVAKHICPIGVALYGSRELVDAINDGRRDVPTISWVGPQAHDEWIGELFPDTPVTYRTNSGAAELRMARLGLGVARLACVLGDVAPELHRIPLMPVQSTFSLWVLSHVDLRTTARVRSVRDFLVETVGDFADLITGYPNEADVIVPDSLRRSLVQTGSDQLIVGSPKSIAI